MIRLVCLVAVALMAAWVRAEKLSAGGVSLAFSLCGFLRLILNQALGQAPR